MERYQVFELIGEGSFGKVYRGQYKKTGEQVALKMIPKSGRTTRELMSLRQECEIQKGLKHPNIIQMLDSVETADHMVVVTEYAKGDIYGLLCREKKMSVRKVQFIAYNLVSALHYLHDRRILHRDIKPQNILIGYDGLAKLCDFGFARTMGITTYMLTSIKGTPLYMAPEIVKSQPYDHNADLWSLGCILFELLNGAPPFPTQTIVELVTKIGNEDIVWPPEIYGDCKSFLQGLLQKDPQKRLSWPDLLQHPFVQDCLLDSKPQDKFSLTVALSPSQELAKETQREILQRKLDSYSKKLIRTAKKLEEAQKEMKRCSNDMKKSQSSLRTKTPTRTVLTSPQPGSSGSNANSNLNRNKTKEKEKNHQKISPKSATAPTTKVRVKLPVNDKDNNDDDSDTTSVSSCETMTSTSSSLSEVSEDDGQTVILDPRSPAPSSQLLSPTPDYNYNYNNSPRTRTMSTITNTTQSPHFICRNFGSPTPLETVDFEMGRLRLEEQDSTNKIHSRTGGGAYAPWKSGALFTLHSQGSEDKPIESDEWIAFVETTMKEVKENPECLCDKHVLNLVVGPLRNHLAASVVIERIASLLTFPFSPFINMKSDLQKKLEGIYWETKVVPNLIYACKLMVRRRLKRDSLNLKSNDHGNELANIMEQDDLKSMTRCMHLISFLVHRDRQKSFAVQFCDSVCVFKAFPILLMFLRLHSKCVKLTVDTLTVLCTVMRYLPVNTSYVEDLVLVYDNFDDDNPEIFALLSHEDSVIQSKAIRLLGYLLIHSDKIREEFIRPRSSILWDLLSLASTNPDSSISAAAEFTSHKLQQFLPSNKSSKGSNDLNNLSVSQ